MESFSQYGQDRFVDQYVFEERTGGFFVDIGAHDGVSLSNTVFFERHRGWDGVCVEPMPERFAQLQSNRQCRCVQGCVSPTSGVRQFTMVTGAADMLSGLASTMSADHRQRIESELQVKGGQTRVIEVQCHTFNQLMEQCNAPRIDFCSIDTEGCELDILRSIDFSRFPATCYCIEDNNHVVQIRRFFKPLNYRLVEKLGQDLIFVHGARAAQMQRVGFLRPGALAVRAARAIARRVGRAIWPWR